VTGVLIDNSDNATGATSAFRFTAHMAENSANRRTFLPGAYSFSDIVIGQYVAGTDDHRLSQFGKISNYFVFQ
jgi:hypothetical protein